MKLHFEDEYIRKHYLDGMTGLELESHRVDQQGHLSDRPHPFEDNPYVDRDFSEDQIEINTPPTDSPEEALEFLSEQLTQIHQELRQHRELLWPFSNPPIIRNEEDIPIAVYTGDQAPSYYYRIYLAERYGKYKMTYSGIHFNYSFSETLLRRNFEIEKGNAKTFRAYQDQFYLKLAEKVLAYSWVVVALLAASPLVDNSFYEAGKSGRSLFTGFSSLRCSEYGYWNPFLPILSYDSVSGYADSIEQYLDQGLLIQARELYYPVRIKPPGKYTLQALREKGISHIELRMIDLNPFAHSGVEINDLEFLRLLLIWLAAQDFPPLDQQEQMQALQNHKTAAGFDWDIGRITMPGQRTGTLRQYLETLLHDMTGFFSDLGDASAAGVLSLQEEKLRSASARYTDRVRKLFGDDYIGAGIQRAMELQEAHHV